jgi:hypothetical protein
MGDFGDDFDMDDLIERTRASAEATRTRRR